MDKNINEHFIENIDIKNFKCFKDFKADGFKRVNLIGGKNNVGKTAFMEACYLAKHTANDFYKALLVIELLRDHRKELEIIQDTNSFDFRFTDAQIYLNNKSCSLNLVGDDLYTKPEKNQRNGIKQLIEFYQGNYRPLKIENNSFLSLCNINKENLKNLIGDIKFLGKWEESNSLLNRLFDVEYIDYIKDKVFLKQHNNHIEISDFGGGIQHFIYILLSLFANSNNIIFIDEIENGIHYSILDTLWEVILTISKEQNVQVFATTHSKECIESYARIAKKLDDNDITYSILSKLKSKELLHTLYDSDILEAAISNEHEVR